MRCVVPHVDPLVRPLARLALPLLSVGLWLAPMHGARAGGLKGQVLFPNPAPTPSSTPPPIACWRIENGVLLPAPLHETRDPVMLVLEPMKLPDGDIPTVELEAKKLRLEPRIVAGQKGATVRIKNSDKVPRTFYLKGGDVFMPREATAPGAAREVKLTELGDYAIADADYPFGGALVLIVNSPYAVRADDKGNFAFEVPDGKYILRAWYRGAWNEGQAVDVGKGPKEVVVKVAEPVTKAEEKK